MAEIPFCTPNGKNGITRGITEHPSDEQNIMPRSFKLTWQEGVGKRAGRWRKKYHGQVYYFPGGRGKSDRPAYEAAVRSWEQLKLQIDADAPKPHQADYEQEIDQWEEVLAWCRNNRRDENASVAIVKLATLRRNLSMSEPVPVSKEDRFAGQFDVAVRSPALHALYKEIGDLVEGAAKTIDANKLRAQLLNSSASKNAYPASVIDPSQLGHILDFADPLKLEQQIWEDRLEVMRRAQAPKEKTLQAYVDQFLAGKTAAADAEELSKSRIYMLRNHLAHFADWLGHETPVVEIKSATFSDYHLELLKMIESKRWSRSTARDHMSSVRSFVRWLWENEAITNLPRNIDGKSSALKISLSPPVIIVYEKAEIATLFKVAAERTKLFILLMLNCGMTQKDIADLDHSEVNWNEGRISRKRSKTKGFQNVPVVDYVLWPETLRLLTKERSQSETGSVLLNKTGSPLWSLDVQGRKMKKNDNIRSAFNRLRKKTGINKPLKSFKKTSASLIRDSGKYASLESLFLGHAPQSMSDKHYTTVPQNLFDEAISWLGTEYGIADGSQSPN